MKIMRNMAAQGDFIILRIKDIPEGVVPVAPENGKVIVAHSETGHNHVMEATRVEAFEIPADKSNSQNVDLYKMFLLVKEDTQIDHLRSFDTHETIMVPPGTYEVRRQREYTAEGFRKAAD
jgi:hypothetical protein